MTQHVRLDFLWIDSDALTSGGEVMSLMEEGGIGTRCRGSFRPGKLELHFHFFSDGTKCSCSFTLSPEEMCFRRKREERRKQEVRKGGGGVSEEAECTLGAERVVELR